MNKSDKAIRVLIVDDSAFARLVIARHLSVDGQIEIAGVARDGLDALEKIRTLKPDVVTLDVEMPKLDGISTLERIMSDFPMPVIMLSNLTAEGADVTIRALEIGAVDFFLKPTLLTPTDSGEADRELVNKIKQAAMIDVARVTSRLKLGSASLERGRQRKEEIHTTKKEKLNRIVIIGSSTGGPRALYQVVPNIPADIDAAILIVQHMPARFTRSMAERLDELSQIRVKEAEERDIVSPGQALVAPGGFHMAMKLNGQIALNQEKPRCGLRPAVDVTMEAAARVYGQRCVGVILTGMGCDGTQGAATIKAGGGTILAEDESTCVVYGMPRSAAEAGLVDKVVPLPQMADEITATCNNRSTTLVNSWG
jgi:two-component system, chemotaxis family, protein-glutamate methylesterase/glutaminase